LTAVNYNAWTLEFRQTGMMTVTLLPAVTWHVLSAERSVVWLQTIWVLKHSRFWLLKVQKDLSVSHYVPTLQVVTRVPKATEAEMLQAVASAKEAFKTWSQLSILSRQQVMFRYQDVIRRNMVSTELCSTVKCCWHD
jgi:hypothetical protein